MKYDRATACLNAALADLKDFQRATVDRVIQSYSEGNTSRVLVADEVGLGKTIVAKGVIAELLKQHLQERGARAGRRPMRVTYICSNQTLAQENRAKLVVFHGEDAERFLREPSYGRLVHTAVRPVEGYGHPDAILEVCSMTPSTSFNLTNGHGNARERAIILRCLMEHEDLAPHEQALTALWQGEGIGWGNWERECEFVKEHFEPDPKITKAFLRLLEKKIPEQLQQRCELVYPASWADLLWDCAKGREWLEKPNQVRACIRTLLAQACAGNLRSDLFILDEFQRFKALIESPDASEESLIARQVFAGKNKHDNKVLLLSATPFKAYSQRFDDDEGDGHAQELNTLLRFISDDNTALVDTYNRNRQGLRSQLEKLKNSGTGLGELDVQYKRAVEGILRPLISRTERAQISEGYDGVYHTDSAPCVADFSQGDIAVFRALDKLAAALQEHTRARYQGNLLQFYKSAPWALSFLSGYQLRKMLDRHIHAPGIPGALRESSVGWVSRKAIKSYSLDVSAAPHAKMRALVAKLFTNKPERLLWVPPSLTRYPLEGDFSGQQSFSKTLLFSALALAPRALSGLLSYESERRLVRTNVRRKKSKAKKRRGAGDSPNYFHKHKPKLRLDEHTNYAGWSLAYPALSLLEVPEEPVGTPLMERIRVRKQHFRQLLEGLDAGLQMGRQGYGRWYALAPLLLDQQLEPGRPERWLVKVRTDRNLKKFSERARGLLAMLGRTLGPMPKDLPEYLAYLSLASPAVASYKAFAREWPELGRSERLFSIGTQVGLAAISMFNRFESVCILEQRFGSGAYFQAIAKYCAEGDLPSVIDEYLHLLKGYGCEHALDQLCGSFGFSASHVSCHFAEARRQPAGRIESAERSGEASSLRCHFAVPLGTQSMASDEGLERVAHVRDVFNSPFRPFVLASTSIGQEGLDFHWYCNRVVHWSLPANPIDIEQREGRVNRYKSLVVRRRVVQAHAEALAPDNDDRWLALFELAERHTRQNRRSDLVPFWHYPEGDAVIERYVPLLPFSREVDKLDNMLEVLTLYRLAFGQPRQEELVENLLRRQFTDDEIQAIKRALIIDLSPISYGAPEPARGDGDTGRAIRAVSHSS